MQYQMKSTLEGINRMDEGEDQIGNTEDVVMEDTQLEKQQEKRIQRK